MPASVPGLRTTVASGPRQQTLTQLGRASTATMARPLDYLKSFGSMPVGYRPSTISSLSRRGKCSVSSALANPGLVASGVSLRDLAIDPATQTVRKRFVKTTCKVLAVSAKGVPPPGPSAQVVARRLRACLWDTERGEPVGCSHVVSAVLASSKPGCRQWKFPSSQGIWIRRSGENAFLMRSGSSNPEVCLLFELCIVARRIGRTADAPAASPVTDGPPTVELSCGWAKLPLFSKDGAFVAIGKTHKLSLEGGTPHDSGVEIDPLEAKGKGKGPILMVKLTTLSRADQNETATLPANVVTAFSTVPLMASFRQLLLEAVIRRGMPRSMAWPAPVSEPAISAFLREADDALLLEALKALWFKRVKSLGRKDCRNVDVLKKHFSSAVLQLFPLLGDISAPASEVELFATEATLSERTSRIQQFVESPMEATLARNSEGILFRPFTIAETTFRAGPEGQPTDVK